MPIPAVLAGIMIGAGAVGAGAKLYSQHEQRSLYSYQRRAYERQLEDWHRNVPNRQIVYPELSYPGHIRALDTGIRQSYASGIGTVAGLAGSYSGGLSYGSSYGRTLYGRSSGRSFRYL